MSDSPVSPDATSPDPAAAPGSRTATMLRSGIATMLVGAVLLGVAMVATTTSSPQPECPAGTVLVAKYNLVGGTYVAERSGSDPAAVTIVGGDATSGSWTSTTPISVVIVKGGPGSKATTLNPAANAGSFTNAELPRGDDEGEGGDRSAAISNVQFCGPQVQLQRPTTTLAPTTTAPPAMLVTLAARTCPAYTDIFANKNRNNLQESLENLGPNTNYTGSEVVNPVKESQSPQDRCSPLTGWSFQWGTGITGKSPSTANLSTVTGQNAIATTVASTPELDANGNPTGRTINGAVTYTLTSQQAADAPAQRLWIQGGTKAAPLGDGTLSFGAIRCATDNVNGDNVEYVKYPAGTRHVFCYAYYVRKAPEPISLTIKKTVTQRSPGGTTFNFGGDTSFIPGGVFTLTPATSGGSAEIKFIRQADVDWRVTETVPEGWTLQSLTCTTPTSGRTIRIDGAAIVANLAPGDAATCTFTNDKAPAPTTTSSTTTSSTTTSSTTTSTTTTSTTTTSTTTTTTVPPTTVAPTTTEGPTSTTSSSTTSSSTTSSSTTSSVPGGVTTTTSPTQVGAEVVTRTSVTPDDVAASAPAVLAFTGGSSLPWVVVGIVLLLVGATLAAVSWQRQRRSATA